MLRDAIPVIFFALSGAVIFAALKTFPTSWTVAAMAEDIFAEPVKELFHSVPKDTP